MLKNQAKFVSIVKNGYFIPLLLYLFAFLYFLFIAQYGVNFTDEGFFLESIHRINNGQLPFQDFYCSYFPGRYYIGALVFRLFGENLLALRYILCLLWALIPLLAYKISQRFIQFPISLLPAILLMLYSAPYYNRFYHVSLLVSLWAELFYIKSKSNYSVLILLVTSVLSLWLRQDIGIVAFCISFFLIIFKNDEKNAIPKRRKNNKHVLNQIFIFLLGYIFLNFPFFWFSITKNHFFSGLKITMDFASRAYFDTWQLPYPALNFFTNGWSFTSFTELLFRVLFHIQFYILITHILYFLLIYWSRVKKQMPRKYQSDLLHIMLILWQLAVLFYVSLRTSETHFFMSAAPFYFSGAFLYDKLTSRIFISIRKSSIFIKGIYLLSTLFILSLIAASFTKGDFYTGSLGILKNDFYLAFSKKVNVYCDKGQQEQLFEITRLIQARTKESDSFMAIPCFSLLNFAVERENPSYYLWLTPDVVTLDVQKEVIKEMHTQPPPYLIYMNLKIDGMKSRQFSVYAAILQKYLKQWYVPEREIGASGWSGTLTLLRREKKPILLSLTELMTKGLPNTISATGAFRVQSFDLGNGRVPYLIMSAGAKATISFSLSSAKYITLSMLKPIIINGKNYHGLSLLIKITNENLPVKELKIPVSSENKLQNNTKEMLYYDFKRQFKGKIKVIFQVTQKQFSEIQKDALIAIGYPRFLGNIR